MKHVREVALGMTLGVVCMLTLTGCGSVQSAASVVPGASYIPGLAEDESGEPKEGDKLHLKISPDEALEILAKVAPQHGWQLAAVGEQYDLQGLRGKYFRLETTRFLGGATEMNGVFFIEPEGTYVVVGKRNTGLPEDLVGPFTTAVKEKMGTATGETEAIKDKAETVTGAPETTTGETETIKDKAETVTGAPETTTAP